MLSSFENSAPRSSFFKRHQVYLQLKVNYMKKLRCGQMPYLHHMDDSENKKLQKNNTLLLVSHSFSPSFLCLLMLPRDKEPNKRRQNYVGTVA
jgi:hypothetical protein